jgi:hypothetical protein
MIIEGWRVCFTREDPPTPARPMPFDVPSSSEWTEWWRDNGIAPGTPYLISPLMEYDVVLNAFFRAPITQR